MSITVKGVTRAATVFTLAGHPNVAIGILWLPPLPAYRLAQATTAVYDAHGKVLVIVRPNPHLHIDPTQ